ncbi:hypothetical protein ANN_06125, partial [Periplaneta americana]
HESIGNSRGILQVASRSTYATSLNYWSFTGLDQGHRQYSLQTTFRMAMYNKEPQSADVLAKLTISPTLSTRKVAEKYISRASALRILSSKHYHPYHIYTSFQDYTVVLFNYLSLAQRRGFFFQQDGATPHRGWILYQWLDKIIPRDWMGRCSPVKWLPRSPDLTPLGGPQV